VPPFAAPGGSATACCVEPPCNVCTLPLQALPNSSLLEGAVFSLGFWSWRGRHVIIFGCLSIRRDGVNAGHVHEAHCSLCPMSNSIAVCVPCPTAALLNAVCVPCPTAALLNAVCVPCPTAALLDAVCVSCPTAAPLNADTCDVLEGADALMHCRINNLVVVHRTEEALKCSC
jgi:hypothetical protein